MRRFVANGQINLSGSKIGVGLDMRSAKISMPGRGARAVLARQMSIDGDGRMADGMEVDGGIDLTGSRFEGDLLLWGSRFTKGGSGIEAEIAVDLTRIKVNQNLCMTGGFRSDGAVHLTDAEVLGTLHSAGGQFVNPDDTAIFAPGLKVHRDVNFNKDGSAIRDVEFSSFCAEGRVILNGGKIDGTLDLTGGQFVNRDDQAKVLVCRSMRIGKLAIGEGFYARGVVDLRRTAVTGKIEDRDWNPKSKFLVEGLSYSALSDEVAGRDMSKERLIWLKRTGQSSPQVYKQLADYYFSEGDSANARKVLYRGRDARRRKRNRVVRLLEGIFLRFTVGYGFYPFWVLYWLAAIELAGSIFFHWRRGDIILNPGSAGNSVNAQGDMDADFSPAFNPLIYTADLLMPVVNLNQRSIWLAEGSAEVVSSLIVVAGWVLLGAVITGLSVAMKPRSGGKGN
ncbi:hypothetical protein [Solwaraspora sp. WMMA2101]|uniref:hypothetical protein n=1 Tax=Solwaraspora sp. WMMA2101 TaxID=3404124 RepID=UPI003B9313AB